MEMFSNYPSFADLQGFRAGEAPQSTIPSTLLITPYRPDIVVYNSDKPPVALLAVNLPALWTQNTTSNLPGLEN